LKIDEPELQSIGVKRVKYLPKDWPDLKIQVPSPMGIIDQSSEVAPDDLLRSKSHFTNNSNVKAMAPMAEITSPGKKNRRAQIKFGNSPMNVDRFSNQHRI